VVGLAMALAPPGLGWVHRLPILSLISPRYIWCLVALVLTQAAAGGLEELRSGRPMRQSWWAVALVTVSSALSVGLADHPDRAIPLRDTVTRALHDPAMVAALVAPILLAAACFLAFAVCGPRRSSVPVTLLLVTVTVGEAIIHLLPMTREPRSRVIAGSLPPGPVQQLRRLWSVDGLFVGHPMSLGTPQTTMLFGIPDIRALSALPLARYVRYLDAIGRDPRIAPFLGPKAISSPLLDIASVRYVGLLNDAHNPLDQSRAVLGRDPALRFAGAAGHVAFFENSAALPRLRLAHRAIPVASPDEAQKTLTDIGRERAHARELGVADVVFVEPGSDGRHAIPLHSRPSADDEVRRVDNDEDPDQLIVDVRSREPAVLVAVHTYFPGWHATIDGQPVALHPANLMFRAVYVPAGSHRVTFSYQPRFLTLGAWLLLLGSCISIALLYLSRRPQASTVA